jgi:hypothetical protein
MPGKSKLRAFVAWAVGAGIWAGAHSLVVTAKSPQPKKEEQKWKDRHELCSKMPVYECPPP